MILRVTAILLFAIIVSCKAKDPSLDTETELKTAMQQYLYNKANNDSSNVKYRVQKVIYFEDKYIYICEFTVNMKTKLFDTTGIMKANISKDMKKIDRLY